jgi:protein FrlC
MRIGIVSSVYINFPIQEAIRRAAALGYDGIDIWSGRPHVYRHDFSKRELRQIRTQIHDNGLIVSSFMPAFYRYPYDLSNPNPIIVNDSMAYMRECINNAAELGAPIVLIVPKVSLYGDKKEEARKRFLESVDRICTYAQQCDIAMGLEPANPQAADIINTAADATLIVNELGHSNLGVVLDTGHLHLSPETSRQALELLGDKLLQVHINDNDGHQQMNLIPGEGNFDFNIFIETLKGFGYHGFISAELGYQYTENPDLAARRTLDRLHDWLNM